MPFRSKCTGCGQAFTAPDALAGKSVKCPKCGAKIEIPPLAASVPNPSGSVSQAAPSQQAAPVLKKLTSELDDLFNDGAGPKPAGAAQAPHPREMPRSSPLPGDPPAAPSRAHRRQKKPIPLPRMGLLVRGAAAIFVAILTTGNVVALYLGGSYLEAGIVGVLGAVLTASCLGVRPLASFAEGCAEVRWYLLSLGMVLPVIVAFTLVATGLWKRDDPWYYPVRLLCFGLSWCVLLSSLGFVASFLNLVRSHLAATLTTGLGFVMYIIMTFPTGGWALLLVLFVEFFTRTLDLERIHLPEQDIRAIQASVQEVNLPGRPQLSSDSRKLGVMAGDVWFADRRELPGEGMRIEVYLPDSQPTDKSLPCLLIGAAGSNGLTGAKLDGGDNILHLRFAEAGFAVVAFDIDGTPRNNESDYRISVGYDRYRAASGGLFNAELALRFALERFPEIDPKRLVAAGHSSAASLALVWAAQEPRISSVIAFSPVYDWKEAQAEFMNKVSAMPGKFPAAAEFIDKTSPLRHVTTLKCPVYLFHAEDDDVVPIAAADSFVESLKLHNDKFEFVRSKRGGHHEGMHAYGIKGSLSWLDKGGLGTPATTEFLAKMSPSYKKPTAVEKAEAEAKTARSAEYEQRKADILAKIEARRTNPGDTGADDPEKRHKAMVRKAKEDEKRNYSPRSLPDAESAEQYAQLTRIDYVLGDDADAAQRMRQTRTGKRLKLVSRWGVGLTLTDKKAQPAVKMGWDFRDETGPIGEAIIAGLKERTRRERFGEWPLFGGIHYQEPALASGTKKDLIEMARTTGLDGLVVLEVDVKVAGLNRRKTSTIVARVIDLTGEVEEWQSKKLASKDANQVTTALFSKNVLAQIDEHYVLDPVEERDAAAAEARVAELIQQHGEDPKQLQPLDVVCELRYYLAKKLLTPAAVNVACDVLVGKGMAAKLMEGDWERRLAALEQLRRER